MTTLILIIMMIVIGAAIGGVTNYLAIRMLFRPFEVKYIGKWRVPFTPGLIPKRRQELAEQIGKIVVNHLLTPEGVQEKLKDDAFIVEIMSWVKKEGRNVLKSETSVAQFLENHFHIDDVYQLVTEKTDDFLEDNIAELFKEIRKKKVREALPEAWLEKGDSFLPKVADYLVAKGVMFFESEEGKEKLSAMIERFLSGKGTFGNMVSMFLGSARLVDKIQPEVLKFLKDEETKTLIEKLLKEEWKKVKEKEMNFFLQYFKEEEILPPVRSFVIKKFPFYRWLNEPIHLWTSRYEEKIIEHWLPKAVQFIGQAFAQRLGELMEKLRLEEVVKGQVEAFSVERLEEIVISISRRELKMITYLGALLGGIIGFVQGLITTFFT